MQENYAGEPCRRAMQDNHAGEPCRKPCRRAMQENHAGGPCRRAMQENYTGAPCRRTMQERRRSQVLRVAGAASCAANDATRSLPPAGDKLQTCDRAARGLARPLPCSAGLQARGLRFRCCVGSDASAPPRRCRRRTQHRRAGAPHTVAERVQPIPWTVGVVPQSYARHRALVLPPRHRRAEAASDAPTR